MNVLIKNVINVMEDISKIVNISVRNGKIEDINCINANEEEFSEVIDGMGMYIIPGLIDMNCEICDPGYDYKEDMVSISLSAVKSGFTSLTCSPNTDPVIDNKVVVKYVSYIAKENSIINIFPYGHMSKSGHGQEIAEIGEMIKGGIVGISDGNTSIQDNYLLRNIFSYSNMFNIPIITFSEDLSLKQDGIINNGKASFLTGLKGIPDSAEEIVVAKNLILANEKNAKLHLTKISTKRSIELIKIAKNMGVDVTCDVCLHHSIFTENNVLEYDTRYKISPPLRSENDREEIINGLKNNIIDVITSGHAPESFETKKSEFENASFGVSSLEHSFVIAYNYLVLNGALDLCELIKKYTVNPYSILKIENKGKIQLGFDGDFFLFDPKAKTQIISKEFESKAKYSMFEGLELEGAVKYTFVDGNLVYKNI